MGIIKYEHKSLLLNYMDLFFTFALLYSVLTQKSSIVSYSLVTLLSIILISQVVNIFLREKLQSSYLITLIRVISFSFIYEKRIKFSNGISFTEKKYRKATNLLEVNDESIYQKSLFKPNLIIFIVFTFIHIIMIMVILYLYGYYLYEILTKPSSFGLEYLFLLFITKPACYFYCTLILDSYSLVFSLKNQNTHQLYLLYSNYKYILEKNRASLILYFDDTIAFIKECVQKGIIEVDL